MLHGKSLSISLMSESDYGCNPVEVLLEVELLDFKCVILFFILTLDTNSCLFIDVITLRTWCAAIFSFIGTSERNIIHEWVSISYFFLL